MLSESGHAAWFWLPPTVVDKLPKRGQNVRYKRVTVGKVREMTGRRIMEKEIRRHF